MVELFAPDLNTLSLDASSGIWIRHLNLDIDHRKQWPDELLVLLKKFPRDSWKNQTASLSQFWLDKHNDFRHQSRQLIGFTQNYREEKIQGQELVKRLGRSLQRFLSHLNGHHSIEDDHYFPRFRAADKRLAPGFDVLEDDHYLLHEGMDEIAEKFNAMAGSIRSSKKESVHKRAADAYMTSADLFFKRMLQHLADEEDLIIPLMLEQGQ